MVQTGIKAWMRYAKRATAAGLALLLLAGGLFVGVVAQGEEPLPILSMAENDGVALSAEELRRLAAERPTDAAETEDRDDDGIPDAWELYGADFNNDGVVDLPLHLMGADPDVPDIFVEVDWMEGLRDVDAYTYLNDTTVSRSNLDMLETTVNEFAAHGIRLHVDFGPGSIDYVNENKLWDDYPGGAKGNAFPHSTELIYTTGMDTSTWTALSQENLDYLRTPVFRHCMIVTSASIGGYGGWGNNPGMRTLVTSIRSFMHELGHNLGLGHGGSGISTNYKPNYLSTMNYGFMGNDFLFSDYKLPDLDENNLSEPDGIDLQGQTAEMDTWGVSFVYRGGTRYSLGKVAGVAVDWDGDGETTSEGLSMDINNDGTLSTLKGMEDWGSLNLICTSMGSLSGLGMHTITYNANGGSGAPESQKKLKEQPITLRAAIPVRSQHEFLGWATSSGAAVQYAPGALYSEEATVTLYAVWQQNEFAISYDANGGSNAPAAQVKYRGVDLTLHNNEPTRDKYNFMGWATTSAGEAEYSAGALYSEEKAVTLYAVWQPKDFVLTLDKNNANSSYTGISMDIAEDGMVTIPSTLPTCYGAYKKDFAGWSTNAAATTAEYLPGEEIALWENTILYGVWTTPVEVGPNGSTMLDFSYLNQIRWVHLGTGWTDEGWGMYLENTTSMEASIGMVLGNNLSGIAWSSDVVGTYSRNGRCTAAT